MVISCASDFLHAVEILLSDSDVPTFWDKETILRLRLMLRRE